MPGRRASCLRSLPNDPIEYCRGQLAAFSYVSPVAAREVHVLRLRNAFERAGIGHDLRYALRVLSLLRETQELAGGYWFPTPSRAVAAGEQAIVVAPVPTRTLQLHFLGVTRAGYARVCPSADVSCLPKQELDGWLGLVVRDTVAWTESATRIALAQIGPTLLTGKIEFLAVKPIRHLSMAGHRPIWADKPDVAIVNGKEVALCRERTAHERFRYFFGLVKGGRVTAEAPAPKDVSRLQLGFAALIGARCTVAVDHYEGGYLLHLPVSIPRPERQLVLALGTRDSSFSLKTYRLRSEAFLELIVPRLQRLGCDVRSGHG